MKSVSIFCLEFWTLVSGFSLKQESWTTTLTDNTSNCEKYFTYCGSGIFIPVKHIQPGGGKDFRGEVFKGKGAEKGREGREGWEGGKGKSSGEKEKDQTEPLAKSAKIDTTMTPEPPTTHSSQSRTRQAEKNYEQ